MSLIGCLIEKNELIKETSVRPEHFYHERNKTILETMLKLDSEGVEIDVVSLITKNKNIDKKYLGEVLNSVASTERFKTYEKMVLDTYKLRTVKEMLSHEINELEDVEKLIQAFTELNEEDNTQDYNHQQALLDLYDSIENQPEGLSGIDTGFKDLNDILDGFQKGNLIISGARPAAGKTAKMLNHAIAHGSNGGIVVIFSLEMSSEELNKRMISTIGKIDGYRMKRPKQLFNDDDWSKFNEAVGTLSQMNIHIYDESGQTVQDVRSKVKALQRKYPNQDMLIMIDYLQLMRTSIKYESKNVEVGEITRSLKELARDVQAPVYLLSQLSRGVEMRQDKRPVMSDIRDSGSVEQDANVIEFLYRDDYYNKESKSNTIEVIIAKHRSGSIGTVELAFIKEYSMMADLAHDY